MNALSSIQRLFLLAFGLMIVYLVLTRVSVLSSWLPEAKWWKAALGLLFGTVTLIWYIRAQRPRHD